MEGQEFDMIVSALWYGLTLIKRDAICNCKSENNSDKITIFPAVQAVCSRASCYAPKNRAKTYSTQNYF